MRSSPSLIALEGNIMAQEIRLEKMGQTMEEGTIVNVLIKEGDKINRGDVILEVETDKATLEMTTKAGGFVKKIFVSEGATIPVGELVCIVGEENEQIDSAVAAPAAPAAAPAAAAASAAPAGGQDLPADAKVVRLQKLGQTMEEGTVVTALVKDGDNVKRGDVVFEIETDKATLEMTSNFEGVVKAMLVAEGDVIAVDAPMIILGNADTQITDAMIASVKGVSAAPADKAAPVAQAPVQAPVAVEPEVKIVAAAAKADKVFATPRAKMTASELGVDISTVAAKDGALRIVEADVRKAAMAPKAAAAPAAAPAAKAAPAAPAAEFKLGQTIPITRMQKVVGERMVQSKRDIPCFYLNTTVDMTELVNFRAQFNKTSAVKVSFNDYIVKAMALGCKQFPIMAGQLEGSNIRVAEHINVGLAISVTDGLVAPMCKDADTKSMVELAASNVAMIDRAKNGKLSPDELTGGCITLSNLGAFGVDWFIPIVVPGQCSIIGVGRIKDTLVPQDGNILVRKLMSMTISVDHKVANGAYAAQYLDYVRKLLENTSTFA